MTVQSDVEHQVEGILATALPDVDLRECQVVGHGEDGMLRLVVDHPEGVDHDLCVAVTRALDAAGMRDRYGIEVASPGPEPPLRTLEHYRGAIGERVRVKVRGDERARAVSGVLTEVDGENLKVTTRDGERQIAFDQIQRGRVVGRSEG